MAFFSIERVTWLRRHQRIMHGAIALFWGVFFLFFFAYPEALQKHFAYPGLLQKQLRQMDIHFADLLALHGRLTPRNPDIVFLGIDDASIKLDSIDPATVQENHILSLMHQDWPWSREVHAAIVDRLREAGAKVIILDFLFDKPRAADPLFKAALDRAADRVIVGCNRADGDQSLTFPSNTLIPQESSPDPRVAFVNFDPDGDGVIRKASFHFIYPGASIGQVQSDVAIPSTVARAAEILGQSKLIPEDKDNHWFRFTGTPGSFGGFSVYQLFDPDGWKNLFKEGAYFKDKIVMVGPHGNFQQDLHRTPMGGMDGAEVHLQALNALLHGELLFYSGDSLAWSSVLVALAALAAWLLGITMQRVTLPRALLCAGLSIVFGSAYLFAGFYLYAQGVIIAVAAPLGTFGFTIFSGLSGQYILENMDRARTRRLFERYVSAKVVQEIVDNPSGYYESLKGRRREVTVLFSDLRGFTSMTEKADSEQLVSDLNEYLRGMNRALFQHDGVLDKFIGDAVMAVWGNLGLHIDPIRDACNAVKAALAMQKELVDLNILRGQRGAPPLAMGVGINHGEAVVGNIGSDQQMNFTVIGDSVNLASRLEGTTKEYGVGLLISETVEELVRPFFHLQTVDSIVVKGRVKPVMTYTVHGLKEESLPAEKMSYLEKFEEAMRLYRAEKFAQAREGFTSCLAIYSNDKLSKTFAERSAEFIQNPPPQPWDGSYTMKTK